MRYETSWTLLIVVMTGCALVCAPASAAPASVETGETTVEVATAPSVGTSACDLLTAEDVGTVQERPVVERIPSTQDGSTIQVFQCVYRTEDLTGSVSLTLTAPHPDLGGGARRYWEARFHPAGGHQGKEDPPRPVPDLGEEAFWTSDPVAGSLYVLAGERFLRVSVGGVRDQVERQERATRLALRALENLAAR